MGRHWSRRQWICRMGAANSARHPLPPTPSTPLPPPPRPPLPSFCALILAESRSVMAQLWGGIPTPELAAVAATAADRGRNHGRKVRGVSAGFHFTEECVLRSIKRKTVINVPHSVVQGLPNLYRGLQTCTQRAHSLTLKNPHGRMRRQCTAEREACLCHRAQESRRGAGAIHLRCIPSAAAHMKERGNVCVRACVSLSVHVCVHVCVSMYEW